MSPAGSLDASAIASISVSADLSSDRRTVACVRMTRADRTENLPCSVFCLLGWFLEDLCEEFADDVFAETLLKFFLEDLLEDFLEGSKVTAGAAAGAAAGVTAAGAASGAAATPLLLLAAVPAL